MALKLRDLLNEALYLSIADEEFSPIEPDGSQINVAAKQFNLVMSQYEQQIPYNTEKVLNGEDELADVGAACINTMDYLLGNVVINMMPLNQDEFSSIALVVGLRSTPYWYWHDKANDRIRVYPLPSNSTNKFVIGYRPLITVSRLDDELPTAITGFMQKFLIYQIASDLCAKYKVKWDGLKQQTLTEAYQKMIENTQLKPSRPQKPSLRGARYPVPWLAYLSGNYPGN